MKPLVLTVSKTCTCGGKCWQTGSGWVCDSCDSRVIPYTPGEIEQRKLANGEIVCPDCEDKGGWLCGECDGLGFIECPCCGNESDCKECNGIGTTYCNCGAEIAELMP